MQRRNEGCKANNNNNKNKKQKRKERLSAERLTHSRCLIFKFFFSFLFFHVHFVTSFLLLFFHFFLLHIYLLHVRTCPVCMFLFKVFFLVSVPCSYLPHNLFTLFGFLLPFYLHFIPTVMNKKKKQEEIFNHFSFLNQSLWFLSFSFSLSFRSICLNCCALCPYFGCQITIFFYVLYYHFFSVRIFFVFFSFKRIKEKKNDSPTKTKATEPAATQKKIYKKKIKGINL